MIHFLGHLLDRLLVVIGAFLGSQIPEYMNQYTYRLSGHVEELNRMIENLTALAKFSNKSLDQYIHKFLIQTDSDFSRQGEFMQGVVTRWHELTHIFNLLQESSVWSRPYIFVTQLNYDIAKATLYSFQPGITFNLEELCYTGIGLFIGYLMYQVLKKILLIGRSCVETIVKPSF
jgi:hypothetical protein